MKQKASLFIIVGLLCVGIVVFAILKAAPANAPAKPTVTQQGIKNKLSKNDSSSSKQNQPVPKSPTSSGGNSSSDTQPSPPAKTGKLSNTGPGQPLLLFGAAVVIGYGLRLATITLAYRRTAES